MRRIAIAAVALAGMTACVQSPAIAELLVNVSKSQQRVSVMVDGVEAYRWAVSTGRRGYDTPAGNFRPQRLERHWYSRQYEMTPMPWAMFFHRGYAMHATTEVYNLGRMASHGCVRLRPDNAATLYSLMRRQGMANTRIVVLNGALPALPVVPPSIKPQEPGKEPVKPPAIGVSTSAAEDVAPVRVAKAAVGEEFAAKASMPKAFSAHRGAETPNLEHANIDTASLVAEPDEAAPRRPAKFARSVSYRVSISSDEAQIMRERQEWLRSLDRKYGITH